ncbi:bis(5'-nucleosyl)-tetraphosphatase (symmetrical) YqeK [Weissella coleopterorum]|uniref:bis(5'-nucleosyl)-tetraphosphatase (symmetrical) YqeK n=1 Tax=Weissella coleopterorum TaxID=2714949 RepID=UPI0031B5FB77
MGNNIWHGVVGAEMIQSELDIYDPIILDAVRQHTTGAEEMSLVARIIYMADYIESARNFPGVEEVRTLAFNDLSASVGWQAQHTLEFLIKNKQRVYPLSLLTYNRWSTK